ncbi:MAG: class II glutamine amidotransferase domain-containing protein, partial [Ruminiclostridium sp.]
MVRAGFSYPQNARVLMAHCRLPLQNDYLNNVNNHPFYGQTLDGTAYALEHNGILMDLRETRQKLNLDKPDISTDSYLIAQVLDTKHSLNCQTLKEVCEVLHGSFTFTILDENNNLYICRGDV